MLSSRVEDGYLGLFLAFCGGAACFLVSFAFMLWVGFVAGLEHIEIFVFQASKHQTMNWYEAISLLISLGLSLLTAEFVLRFFKKHSPKPNSR
jgi:hypothetical protein